MSEYWRVRFEQLEAARHADAQTYLAHTHESFIVAQREVKEKVEAWYGRFAKNNEVSLEEARRLLNADELAEFRWSLSTYAARAQENALSGQWTKQLQNASARAHISRLEALQVQMQQSVEKLFGGQADGMDGFMKRTYLDSYYKSAFEVQRGTGVGFNIAGINQGQLESVIRKPWAADGENFSDRIWKQKDKLVNGLHTKLTQAIVLGKNPNEYVKEMAKEFGVSQGSVGRLLHTEMAFFADAAEQESFKELGVEEYQILATLDDKTCPICGPMDRKVFKMAEYEPGATASPFHPLCRCTRAPHFRDAAPGVRIARDAEGKAYHVPADMPYEEWKELHVIPSEGAPPVFPEDRRKPLPALERKQAAPTASLGEPSVAELIANIQPGGHLWSRHVGQTQAELAARLAKKPIPNASAFSTVAEAEDAILAVFSAKAADIVDWLNSGAEEKLTLKVPFSGGAVLRRGATATVQGTRVRFVLRGDGRGGYYIFSGFPQ